MAEETEKFRTENLRFFANTSEGEIELSLKLSLRVALKYESLNQDDVTGLIRMISDICGEEKAEFIMDLDFMEATEVLHAWGNAVFSRAGNIPEDHKEPMGESSGSSTT